MVKRRPVKACHRFEDVEQFILCVGCKIAEQQRELLVPQNLLGLPCINVGQDQSHKKDSARHEDNSQIVPSVIATNGSNNEGLASLSDIPV